MHIEISIKYLEVRLCKLLLLLLRSHPDWIPILGASLATGSHEWTVHDDLWGQGRTDHWAEEENETSTNRMKREKKKK